MGDSPVFNTIKNVAGYGVGTLAALDTIKGGGLGSYLMNRQRLVSDPAFRASLEGSPFQSGIFGISGNTGPAPAPPPPGAYPATAASGGVVQPADMVGPPPPGVQVAPPQMPAATAQNVPGYEPGTPRTWHPLFSPYDPEQALKQQGFATAQIGLGSPNEGVRAQSKMAAGIPLNDQELAAAVGRGVAVQKAGGPGAVVQLDIPGMKTNIGSPYNISAYGNEEYPTEAAATAAASARGPGYHAVPSGRGTWLVAPPPTAEQQLPANLPTPTRPGAPAPTPAAAPAPATPPAPAPATAAAPPPPPQPVPAPRVATVPTPPPPSPPPAAAPSGPPMAGAGAPAIYATPGKAPAYVPPGLPDMAPSVPVAPGSPPGGHIGFPSAAFDDTSGAPRVAAAQTLVTPAPPPAPAGAAPAASSGRIDLRAPWLRQIEAERGLPAGVISGLAEKESGGNASIMSRDPNSTAGGLFQITAPTARAWGLSPADRFDPVKAATATADALAQRAQAVGIERAVGMHYGGPGTPYNQVVGSSGLSPAAYSGDVLARAQKYSGATDGTVGYPSPAPAPPPPPVDYRGVPFRLQEPDLRPATLGVAPPPTPGIAFDIGAPTRPAGLPAIAGPPVDPGTGVPLKTITERDQHGKEQTYTVPDLAGAEVAANMARAGISDWRTVPPDDPRITYFQQLQAATAQRQKLMEADIAQARGPGNTGMRTVLNMYDGYRKALNQYLTDFPRPEDRAPYVGYLNLPLHAIKALAVGDPRFKQFLADTSAFQYHKIDELKGDLSEQEQTMLDDSLPTGHESDAASHEMRLANFNNLVNDRKAMLTAEVTMSPDQLGDPAWWNAANKAVMDQHAADKAAAGGGLGGAYVGATLGAPAAAPPEAPPATLPPMGAPPTPAAPPPFTVLGQWQE
jgi:hypothetical protein